MGPAQTSTVTIGGPGVGNVISANVVGITLTGGDALVQGNLVGTDATGTTALPNGTGIDVVPGGRATIGGTAPDARNVVSGNNGAGMSLNPGPTILGNFIGTDAGGSAALGNTRPASSSPARAPAMRRSAHPARETSSRPTSRRRPPAGRHRQRRRRQPDRHRRRRLDRARQHRRRRVDRQLRRQHGRRDRRRRGQPHRHNCFATSFPPGLGEGGVDIQNGGIGDRVLGNRIFANAGLTIDLGLDGPTPNDPGDGDANASTAAGANNLQNFPVLASAADDGTRLAVTGTLNSLPNTAFRVELFRSIACHATGFGDAAQPIGAVTARTDAAGNAAFSSALASVPAGSVLTATATDPAGNTSEASACLPVSRTGAPVVGGAPVAPIPSAPAPAPVASAPSAPPAPVLHRSVAVAPESGTVLVRRPGASRFTPVEAGALVPLGSALDVSVGRVSLTAARDTAGATQTASFYGGRFVVGQPGGPRPLTELRLDGPSCSSPRGSARIAAVTRKKKRKRSLWGDGKGHFRTRGRYGTATVQGTKWLTEDSCAGTLVRVARGAVAVRDLLRRRTVTVKAGRSYLARARR